MSWTKLSEEKPKDNSEILFCNDADGNGIYFGFWHDSISYVEGLQLGMYETDIDKCDITHWQYVPEKPTPIRINP